MKMPSRTVRKAAVKALAKMQKASSAILKVFDGVDDIARVRLLCTSGMLTSASCALLEAFNTDEFHMARWGRCGWKSKPMRVDRVGVGECCVQIGRGTHTTNVARVRAHGDGKTFHITSDEVNFEFSLPTTSSGRVDVDGKMVFKDLSEKKD